MTEGISLEQIKTGRNYDLISLYEEYDSDDAEPFQYSIAPSCDYLEPDVFRTSYELSNTSMSYFHLTVVDFLPIGTRFMTLYVNCMEKNLLLTL